MNKTHLFSVYVGVLIGMIVLVLTVAIFVGERRVGREGQVPLPLSSTKETREQSGLKRGDLAIAEEDIGIGDQGRFRSTSTPEEFSLSFVVADKGGVGIPDAKVFAVPIQYGIPLGVDLDRLSTFPPTGAEYFESSSDHQGMVALSGFRSATTIAVSCSKKGYVAQRLWMLPLRSGKDGAGQETQVVVLDAGNRSCVTVLDEETQEAIPGASVTVQWKNLGGDVVRSASTDSEGVACIDSPLHQEVSLTVSARGYLPEYTIGVGDQSQTVLLSRGKHIDVLVVKEEDGRPVDGASVFLAELERGSEELANPRSAGDEYFVGETGADGRVLASGVDPEVEEVHLFVQYGSRVASIGPLRFCPSVEVVLPTSVTQKWRVVTPEGDPVVGLELNLVSADLVGWPPIAKKTTDSRGECEFDLVPGSYCVLGVCQDWSCTSIAPFRVESDASRRTAIETAVPASSLEFSVDDGVWPVQTLGFVRVYPQPSGSPEAGQPHWRRMAANLNADQMGELMDGEVFVGLSPGEYQVRFRGEGCVTQVRAATLVPGRKTNVSMTPIIAARARVVVLDELGAPVPRAWVWLSSLEGLADGVTAAKVRGARADSQGQVLFHAAIPGRTRIDAAREFLGKRSSASCYLQAGDNEEISLTIPGLPGECEVLVDPTLSEGSTSVAVRLRRFASDGDAKGSVVAFEKIGPSGQLVLTGLQAGRYRAELVGSSGLGLEEEFLVKDGGVSRVTFDAPNVPERWIEVVDSNGGALSGATVLIVPVGSTVDRRTWQLVLMHPTMGSSRAVKCTTEIDGRARVLELPGSDYEVFAFKEGFQVSVDSLQMSSDSEGVLARLELLPAAGGLSVEVVMRSSESGDVLEDRSLKEAIRVIAVCAKTGREYRLELNEKTQEFESGVLPEGLMELQVHLRDSESGEWGVYSQKQVDLSRGIKQSERVDVAE